MGYIVWVRGIYDLGRNAICHTLNNTGLGTSLNVGLGLLPGIISFTVIPGRCPDKHTVRRCTQKQSHCEQ